MTTPDLTKMVLERLAACGLELGLKRTWTSPPRRKIEQVDTPCAYGLVGPTFQETTQNQGMVNVGRSYIQRFLLFPFAGGSDDLTAGAESNQIALEWIDKVTFYYQARPNLQTAQLPELRYCKGIMNMSDSGLVLRPAPGDESYAAIDFSLNIIMAARVQRAPSPYYEET